MNSANSNRIPKIRIFNSTCIAYRSEVPANVADKDVVFRKWRVLMIQLGLNLKSKIGYVQFRYHSMI